MKTLEMTAEQLNWAVCIAVIQNNYKPDAGVGSLNPEQVRSALYVPYVLNQSDLMFSLVPQMDSVIQVSTNLFEVTKSGVTLTGPSLNELLARQFVLEHLGETVEVPDSVKSPPNLFQLGVGDFSSDGHGYSAYHLVSCAKDLQSLREAHFKSEGIGTLFSEYEETACSLTWLEGFDLLEPLKQVLKKTFEQEGLGQTEITFSNQPWLPKAPLPVQIQAWCNGEISDDNFIDKYEDPEVTMSIKKLFEFWVCELNIQDPQLNLALVSKPDNKRNGLITPAEQGTEPTIFFYGFDEKGRHLSIPGYGLFDESDFEFNSGANY